MDGPGLRALMDRYVAAWNDHDPDGVVAFYRQDLLYRDPGTPDGLRGADALGRYLQKLFAAWHMRWELTETHPLAGVEGGVCLWRASFRRPGAHDQVDADGMNLLVLADGLIARNEVRFDRSVLTRPSPAARAP